MKLQHVIFPFLILMLSCDQLEHRPSIPSTGGTTSINGALDTSFGTSGYVLTAFNGTPTHVKISPSSQKIIVMGVARVSGVNTLELEQYTTAGVLDTASFATSGVLTPSPVMGVGIDMAVQADGKILVLGATVSTTGSADSNAYFLNRYDTAGVLDAAGFNGGSITLATDWGTTTFVPTSLTVDGNGAIVVAGKSTVTVGTTYPEFAMVRYASNGTLDTTFNTTGLVSTVIGASDDSEISGITDVTSSKYIVVGTSCPHLASNPVCHLYMKGYTNAGAADVTYAGGGVLDLGPARLGHLETLTDQSSLVSATFDGVLGILHVSTAGVVDTAYGTSGTAIPPGLKFTLQSNDLPVLLGHDQNSSTLLERFSLTGAVDTDFDSSGQITAGLNGLASHPTDVAVQSDGKAVVVGVASTMYNLTYGQYLFLQRFTQ